MSLDTSWEQNREEHFIVAFALIQALSDNNARLHALGVVGPAPRTHICFHCGILTSQAPTSVELNGRAFAFPAVCSADACLDEVIALDRHST